MIVLILPKGFTLTDAEPTPIEAKVFHDRIALFWRRAKDTGSLVVAWTLRELKKSLQHEVEQLNAGASTELRTTSNITENIVIERQAPATESSSPSITVFYSYSHKDERYRKKLETHLSMLRNSGVIAEWNDHKILAGEEIDGEIDKNLARAQIVLLLVSADYLASKYCYHKEMLSALKRHEDRTATVIPIIVRPVDWHIAPFGKLKALPKDGKAITTWRRPEEGWADVAIGIRLAVENLTRESGMPS